MQGSISSACSAGDIKINWTGESVWFDFGKATTREKKQLIKFITLGRKKNEWEVYVADSEGKATGEMLTRFPKNETRIVLMRKPFEIKNIIESFVNERIDIAGHLVFQMKGRKGEILRPGDFKVEETPKEPQKVVDAPLPRGG